MSKATILLIDDDEGIRFVLEQVLADEGYTCVSAANGKEGLDVVSSVNPDLILLDLMMPKMNGWEFIQEFRKTPQGQTIPILIISASRDIKEVASALHVQGYLTKPFDLDHFLHIMARIMGDQHAQANPGRIS